MIPRTHLNDEYARYITAYPKESARLGPLVDLLATHTGDLTAPATRPSHITAAAALVRGDMWLLARYGARWALPGGHVDHEADRSLQDTARRQLTEALQLPRTAFVPCGPEHPLDYMDVRLRGGHIHREWLYAFRVAEDSPWADRRVASLQGSADFKWGLIPDPSRSRLSGKILRLCA